MLRVCKCRCIVEKLNVARSHNQSRKKKEKRMQRRTKFEKGSTANIERGGLYQKGVRNTLSNMVICK